MQKNLTLWGGFAVLLLVFGIVGFFGVSRWMEMKRGEAVKPLSGFEKSSDDGRFDASFSGVVTDKQEQFLTVTFSEKMTIPNDQSPTEEKNKSAEKGMSVTATVTQATKYDGVTQAELQIGDIVSVVVRPSASDPSAYVLMSVKKEQIGKILPSIAVPATPSDAEGVPEGLPDSMPVEIDFQK